MSEASSPPARAFVALGSNLDDPVAQVRRALAALAQLPATRVTRSSSLYRTAPWGVLEQPPFVNAVAEIETALAPRALLDALLALERAQGRVRDASRWGPRVIDLDLLDYAGRTIDEAGLTLPHPRLHERAFVLAPLADIAPDFVVSGRGRVADLLAQIDARDCVPLRNSNA